MPEESASAPPVRPITPSGRPAGKAPGKAGSRSKREASAQAPTDVKGRLVVRHAGGQSTIPLTNRPVTIGRHPRCTLHVDEDTLSRRHCLIEPGPSGWTVRDLRSRNGTLVNRKRVSVHRLESGDVVQVGSVLLRFEGPSPSEVADAPMIVPADVRRAREVLALEVALRRLVESERGGPLDVEAVKLSGSDGEESSAAGHPMTRLLRLLLITARRARATDLHIHPRRDGAEIRLRVDGVMIDPVPTSQGVQHRLLRALRVRCRLREARRPATGSGAGVAAVLEEGHFQAVVEGTRVDYRVSIAPTMHGATAAIRVLDERAAPQRLRDLGLEPWMEERFHELAPRTSGFVLACGPTGCGKTTTLHAALREVDTHRRNVVTIEDPVEYELERCTQLSVDAEQGRDFASLLRSVLRQDPDVILVGEMRDLETARVAMQSATTGHLVFSTLHARDTVQAIFRLLDMGLDRSLVANALDTIIAQRLVRTLCVHCRRRVRPTTSQLRAMGLDGGGDPPRVYLPVGCAECLRTGYRGRRAIFEMLRITDAIRDEILGQPAIHRIRSIAEQGLFIRLAQFGYRLAARGETSLEEVERIEPG